MTPQTIRVLGLLRDKGRRGVSFDDLPRGTRLAARIHDLRLIGAEIVTEKETLGDCVRARYVMVKEPRRVQ